MTAATQNLNNQKQAKKLKNRQEELELKQNSEMQKELKKAADKAFVWGILFGSLVMFLLLQWVFRPNIQIDPDYGPTKIVTEKKTNTP